MPSNSGSLGDPTQQPGWTVQGSAPAPYSQTGVTASPAALSTAGNGSPGVASPPSNSTSATGAASEILANPGYGDVPPALITSGTTLASSLVPVPASGTAFQSPVALPCVVTIAGGTVTLVQLTPLGGTAVEIGMGDGTYTVPPRASLTLTYSAAPTWTWQTN
jgi:hypothetical protein